MNYSTACTDWQKRLVAGESIIPAPLFDDSAEKAWAIFSRLRLTDVYGLPTFGECAEPWVKDFVCAIFGAYDGQTNRQHINEFGLLISKKNGKSTIAAAIMLTALLLSWRRNEEYLIIAPTKEVAENSFSPACAMIEADPVLRRMFDIVPSKRTVTLRALNSSLKIVSSSSRALSGKKAGRVLVDELWLFGEQRGAQAMLMEALGGQISRPEAFTIFLTTQSDEQPAGIFKDKLTYWRNVRDGVIQDNKVLPILYEFPQEMVDDESFLLPENYRITNPNLGKSVSADWITRGLEQLKGVQDGSFQQFIAKHLNVEIGQNLRSDRWCGADLWPDSADSSVTLDYIIENCDTVTCGIDGGGLFDMLALNVLGRDTETGKLYSWVHCWVSAALGKRFPVLQGKFGNFVNDGDLTIINTSGEDIAGLCDYISKVKHLLPKTNAVGVDPAGIGQIVDALLSDEVGLTERQVMGVPQGWKLNGAIKGIERMLDDGKLKHADSALFSWCVGNAKVNQVGNAVSITKNQSTLEKIDALVALFDAFVMMALNPVRETIAARKRKTLFLTLGG